jgi:hypothetical protein
MAQQIQPVQQTEFGGVVTAGNPIRRPPESASLCRNIRVMPGNWLRLRGGRKLQWFDLSKPNGRYRRFYEVRLANGTGTTSHLAQYFDGVKSVWRKAEVTQAGYMIFDLEEISHSYLFQGTDLSPVCTVRDRVFIGNGLGVRGSVGGVNASYSPLTQWDGSNIRYVGLDNYCPGGSPIASFTVNAGGGSRILYGRNIYVGLYNQATGHFGNGILAGKFEPADPGNVEWVGDISIAGLAGLQTGVHASGGLYSPSSEQSELKYVVYATGDGGATPYLVVNGATGEPIAADYGSSALEVRLSSDPDDVDAHVLDVMAEMPTENFPPRTMSTMAYANGRVYGALSWGGVGSVYEVSSKDICAVVWSAAADDVQDRDFLGSPEESWPRTNRKFTPNGEQPLHIAAAQDGTKVLVITHSGTFLLEETADGLHTWDEVSATSGIWSARSFVTTPYGSVWLDQHRQIVLLPHGSNRLTVLSGAYSRLLSSVAKDTPADYVFSPIHEIDRYQIWIGGGLSVIHDFAIGGQGYQYTGPDFTCAATMLDIFGNPHHIVAREAVWSQESDPLTGEIVTYDQGIDWSMADITGEWIGQWNNFGDRSVRKEFREWTVTGDCDYSEQLGDSPVKLSWFADLTDEEYLLDLAKSRQGDTDHAYVAKISSGNRKYFKLRVQIRGHRSDLGATYTPQSASGDLKPVIYGSVWLSEASINGAGNNR